MNVGSKEYIQWYKEQDDRQKELIEIFDALIADGSHASYDKIAAIIEDEISDEDYRMGNELAYVILAVNIYMLECEKKRKKVIFDNAKDVRELMYCMNKIRFFLIEIEHEWDDEQSMQSMELLAEYVNAADISDVMLINMISSTCMDKYRIAVLLAKFYEGRKELFAMQLLLYANTIRPGEEGVCRALADIFVRAGNAELADTILSSIDYQSMQEYAASDAEANEQRLLVAQQEKELLKKVYKPEKIAFIMCVNDEQYMDEALWYINNLYVPEGFSIDVFTVEGAKSMTSGYNEAMAGSDAKYKVYMHQDVFIINKYFIYYMLDCFEKSNAGMMGIVGSTVLPRLSSIWGGEGVGWIYSAYPHYAYQNIFCKIDEDRAEVNAVDGLLIATQVDVRWREDVFDKWDFYDISQSLEMKKNGRSVVVPKVYAPLVMHDDGFLNLRNYYTEREKFIKEYFGEE